MKNITTILMLIMITACTTTTKPSKPITQNSSCEEIQKEINRLKSEKKRDLVNTTATVLTGHRFPYGQEEKNIDEKIKVLEMWRLECK